MSDGWQESGLCREVGGDMFFPNEGGNPRPAIAICLDCPVAARCLLYALENNIKEGVWGGTTGAQRARIRRRAA